MKEQNSFVSRQKGFLPLKAGSGLHYASIPIHLLIHQCIKKVMLKLAEEVISYNLCHTASYIKMLKVVPTAAISDA